MNTQAVTSCGPLYLEGLNVHGFGNMGSQAFAAGFVSGQAEKVYLGACQAAMFRPSAENFDWLLRAVGAIAKRYSLSATARLYGMRELTAIPDHEIWIFREWSAMEGWMACEKNSPAWHLLRATACGIPAQDIDLQFHLRQGATGSCDHRTESENATQ